jgi:hypothetical protein
VTVTAVSLGRLKTDRSPDPDATKLVVAADRNPGGNRARSSSAAAAMMVSSTLLTLIVIPAIYAVVKGIAIRSPRLAPAFKRP